MFCYLLISSLLACFPNELSSQEVIECEKNEDYINHKQSIDDEKDRILLTLLKEYEDEYQKIVPNEELLKKLTDIVKKLDDFENDNRKLDQKNDELTIEIDLLLQEIEHLKNELNNIHSSDEKEVTVEIGALLDDLEKWMAIAEKFNKKNLTNEIMNLPYSISDEIDFLEHIISNKDLNSNCTEQLERELKNTYEEIAELLKYDGILKEIREIENISKINKKVANELITQAEAIEKEEEILNATEEIAEDILKLAKEVEEKKLNSAHEIKTRIEKLGLSNVQEEIYQYEHDVDCFYKFISNCRIGGNATESECMKEYECTKSD